MTTAQEETDICSSVKDLQHGDLLVSITFLFQSLFILYGHCKKQAPSEKIMVGYWKGNLRAPLIPAAVLGVVHFTIK